MSREIHSANFKLEMYKLTDETNIPKAKRGELVGPIISVTATFPTNDIPTLEMEVPLGRKISEKSLDKSYVYEDELKTILKERKPIGVYLTVEKTGKAPLIGLEEGTLCLFKGYAMNASEENGINGGSMRLSISHWLCDLSIFPILHRLSSPENSADVATDSTFQEKVGGDSQQGTESNLRGCAWTAAGAYRNAMEKVGNDLLAAIKIGFNTTLKDGRNLKPTDPGYVNATLFQKVDNSLKAVVSENLDFMKPKSLCRWAIADALAKENRDAYFSVTLWQKLVQSMLPQFYASIIPTVNKGIVIPQPGIHMDPAKAQEIDKNTILSLRTRTAYGKTLGGVVLAGRPGAQMPFGLGTSRIKSIRYPEKDKPEPGVLKTCYLPPWLEIYTERCGSQQASSTQAGSVTSPDAASTAESEVKDHTKELEDQKSEYEKFANAFAKSVYQAEITKGNAATLTSVLNLKLCPGAVVKIPIPSDVTFDEKDQLYCYGTIHTAQYTISPDTAISSFVLTNVRTQEQADAYKTTNGLLYLSGWYNNKQKLYVKE